MAVCRNCIETVRTVLETVVETVVIYIETVIFCLKVINFNILQKTTTVSTNSQQFLQRFLQRFLQLLHGFYKYPLKGIVFVNGSK